MDVAQTARLPEPEEVAQARGQGWLFQARNSGESKNSKCEFSLEGCDEGVCLVKLGGYNVFLLKR